MTAVVTDVCAVDREYSLQSEDEITYTGVEAGGEVRECPRCESRVFVAPCGSVTHLGEARCWDSALFVIEESPSLVLLFPRR